MADSAAQAPPQPDVDLSYRLDCFKDLKGRVAIITGSTRGIGRCCALKLASLGCNIVIAAKTVDPQPTLPGTVHSVAAECEALGVEAMGVRVDNRDAASIQACVDKAAARWGRIDILINNASALWWQRIVDTPPKKFDLIMSINARGSLMFARACLPHMERGGFGRVICMSPPIANEGFAGRTAYNISKMGMTMVAMGVSEEYKDQNITGNTLWPATVVESYASVNFKLGNKRMWRKAEVIADAAVGVICSDGDFSGHQLIDDEYLSSVGLNDQDMKRYRCDPDYEPPRVLSVPKWGSNVGLSQQQSSQVVKRGDVKKLDKDIDQSRGWGNEQSKL